MMKLQAVDYLSGEMDRHDGNYFIGKDSSGHVAIGFDNDFSWSSDELPGWRANDRVDEALASGVLPDPLDHKSASRLQALASDPSPYIQKNGLKGEQVVALQQRLDGFKGAIERGEVKVVREFLNPKDGRGSHNKGIPPILDRQTASAILLLASDPSAAAKELGIFLKPDALAAFGQRLGEFIAAISKGEVIILDTADDWDANQNTLIDTVLSDPKRSYAGREIATQNKMQAKNLSFLPLP